MYNLKPLAIVKGFLVPILSIFDPVITNKAMHCHFINYLKIKRMVEKEILTLEEFSLYSGFSKAHIYKLTHFNKIPHYKPGGKMVFFRLEEVKEWLLSNRISSTGELEIQASKYMLNQKNKK